MEAFKSGDFVKAHSLKTEALNGEYGLVLGQQGERYLVQLLSKSHGAGKKLKPENMVRVELSEVPQGILACISPTLDQAKMRILPPHQIPGRAFLNKYSILEPVHNSAKEALVKMASGDFKLNRIMGSMMGMAVGDALGHPYEFQDAVDEPCKESHFDLATKTFTGELNTFKLQRGQWTDDCSMGLCMADSLILRKCFDGSDMRVRFWCWWNGGYNNAFRLDNIRGGLMRGDDPNGSVGLGGNISKSLADASRTVLQGEETAPTPRYEAPGEDAGNGSLMRFAPIAIFGAHMSFEELHSISRESSYTTHPGIMAAEACALLAHLIRLALDRPQDSKETARDFLERGTQSFMEVEGLESKSGPGYDQLKWLVKGDPPNDTEYCWRWRSERIGIEKTLKARGRYYNGYGVDAGYFGSFCMDGMALALWSFYHSESFDEAVTKSINLRGDADSHGSITGQLAGAFYGYRQIDLQFTQWVNQWDEHEIACRALLLHHLAPSPAVAA